MDSGKDNQNWKELLIKLAQEKNWRIGKLKRRPGHPEVSSQDKQCDSPKE